MNQNDEQQTQLQGTVNTWFPDKGFGFIEPDVPTGHGDVFAHASEVLTPDHVLQVGQRVSYIPRHDHRGRLRAHQVVPLSDTPYAA